jgi:hypothetical protein
MFEEKTKTRRLRYGGRRMNDVLIVVIGGTICYLLGGLFPIFSFKDKSE